MKNTNHVASDKLLNGFNDKKDGRGEVIRPVLTNRLSEEEEQRVLPVCQHQPK